ncbi:MAG: glutamate-5-semialdehyde dehydrogenase [Candidatus Acidiferrales bacterium]
MTAGSDDSVKQVATRARAASRVLARLSHGRRNEALLKVAGGIEESGQQILAANKRDREAAQLEVAAGKMSSALFSRLEVTGRGVKEMAGRIRDVARLPDPVGRLISKIELDDGLILCKDSCPLGVVGIVFESRPDVIPQVASLTLKSANAVILKGGAEAGRTNEVMVSIWRSCLREFPDIPEDAIQLLRTRADALELLSLDRDVDLIIPRGSRELVEFVAKNSRIPVLGHGEGICHVYVDCAADIAKAVAVAYDSKVQYPAACNAVESLLVHETIADEFLPQIARKLRSADVELRGCSKTAAMLAGEEIRPATDADWSTEYSDKILSIKIVGSLEEAIEHIARFGSRHTEAIVTEDGEAAKRFLEEVDAAGVYHNVSTRFADGFRYGLGAELGISTSKLHARGPVGLEGLVTYKYKLSGDGHTVAEYSSGKRTFQHRTIG